MSVICKKCQKPHCYCECEQESKPGGQANYLQRIVSRKLRKQCDGLYVAGDEDTITDGYAEWSAWCCMCGNKTMQIVRPGKVQCANCG